MNSSARDDMSEQSRNVRTTSPSFRRNEVAQYARRYPSSARARLPVLGEDDEAHVLDLQRSRQESARTRCGRPATSSPGHASSARHPLRMPRNGSRGAYEFEMRQAQIQKTCRPVLYTCAFLPHHRDGVHWERMRQAAKCRAAASHRCSTAEQIAHGDEVHCFQVGGDETGEATSHSEVIDAGALGKDRLSDVWRKLGVS
ncbi:hypothetical protein GGX14DRAFT_593966 [Mycena pura]|uniref:Uncharacterized protein n=1 Tax=Mycena pura TaxID=153505 RepID=A0AAD6UUZ7_9AGAR|nr:hypothetical protein GGX14DRAFT_593966 [Mycena pura]